MVSGPFMHRQFVKAGLTKGSKDDTQFKVGLKVIHSQPKLMVSTREEMIRILREFIGI